MKSLFLFTASILAVVLAQGPLTINTPADAVQCEPTLLDWTGGNAPYFLSILPGNTPGGAALEDLGQQSGTSFTWNTNIAAGTSVGLTLRDSTGAIAQSAAFTIQPGTSSACLGQPQSTGAPSGSPPPTSPGATPPPPPTSPPATTPPSQTTPKPSTTGPATSGAPASKSSAPPASTSHSGAASTHANLGAAGVFAAALLALLA